MTTCRNCRKTIQYGQQHTCRTVPSPSTEEDSSSGLMSSVLDTVINTDWSTPDTSDPGSGFGGFDGGDSGGGGASSDW